VSDIALYSIHSGILRQWRFLRKGVMWWCLGFFVRALARALYVGYMGTCMHGAPLLLIRGGIQ